MKPDGERNALTGPDGYSDISAVRGDRILVRGRDLVDELIGVRSFTDTVFLLLTGRLPSPAESGVVDAALVSLVDHGVTPSSLVARMTYRAAPDAIQGALAAGVLTAGGRMLGSMQDCGEWLVQWAPGNPTDRAIRLAAAEVVLAHRSEGRPIAGIGHASHKTSDARAVRLLALQPSQYRGRYVGLLEAVAQELARVTARPMPINVTGAIAAILLEIGIDWRLLRGFGILSRLPALVAHIAEEQATGRVGTLVRNLQHGSEWNGVFQERRTP